MQSTLLKTLRNNLTSVLFKSDISSNNQFPINTEVVGLSSFEMPWVYHHIAKGTELRLRYNYNAATPQKAVEIFYKNFKLGHLPGAKASLIEKVMMHGFDLKVKVRNVFKQKYMPISQMKIEINENLLQY